MRLVMAENRLLKEPINIISDLVNEVRMRVNSDGIEIVAIDPANVAMVEYKLLSSAFVEYETTGEQVLAISLDGLKAVMRRIKPHDVLTLKLDEEKNRLDLSVKGSNNKTFHLPLLHIDDEEQKLPNLQFGAKVNLSAANFDDAVEDMEIVAESVSLVASGNLFTVKSEDNLKAAKVEIPGSEEVSILSDDGEEISSKYSIEYLKKMTKAAKLAETVSLNFGQDYPLRMEYILLDKMKMSFVLAPRVSND